MKSRQNIGYDIIDLTNHIKNLNTELDKIATNTLLKDNQYIEKPASDSNRSESKRPEPKRPESKTQKQLPAEKKNDNQEKKLIDDFSFNEIIDDGFFH